MGKISVGLRDPAKIGDWLERKFFHKNERILAKLLNSSVRDIISFQKEFQQNYLMKHLRDMDRQIRKYAEQKIISSNPNTDIASASLYYALLRSAKPDTVVETGVANGLSSAANLFALEQNGTGKLYSIDLPNSSTSEPDKPVPYVPEGAEVGWLVPDDLRKRWKLILGDAKDLLPKILEELDEVDLFIHDSLHTYGHMLWECRTVWPHLKANGILIVHDADWNNAFDDFRHEIERAKAGKGYKSQLFGIIKKT